MKGQHRSTSGPLVGKQGHKWHEEVSAQEHERSACRDTSGIKKCQHVWTLLTLKGLSRALSIGTNTHEFHRLFWHGEAQPTALNCLLPFLSPDVSISAIYGTEHLDVRRARMRLTLTRKGVSLRDCVSCGLSQPSRPNQPGTAMTISGNWVYIMRHLTFTGIQRQRLSCTGTVSIHYPILFDCDPAKAQARSCKGVHFAFVLLAMTPRGQTIRGEVFLKDFSGWSSTNTSFQRQRVEFSQQAFLKAVDGAQTNMLYSFQP
eukprot:1148515-Pelagomonas_calceolata.AAC.3